MSYLNINNKRLSFEELKKLPLGAESDFETKTLKYCKNWLLGKKEFEISTSGSTGTPKIIKLQRAQMEASAHMTIQTFGLDANDHLLVNLHPSFIAGLMMLVRGLESRAEITVIEPTANPLENFSPEASFSFLALVPMQLQNIISNPQTKTIFEKAKAAIIGGAAVGSSLMKEIKNLKPALYSTYGMTETVTHIAIKRINGTQPDQYFQALPGIQLSQDKESCLCIKGKVTSGETIVTNDVVELFEGTKFNWTGRRDNIINSGGIKIQLEKVEAEAESILAKLGYEGKPVALAMPDEKLGEKLVLAIEQKKEALDLEQFKTQLKEALPSYHSPKEYFFVDQIPLTPTQKVDRIGLRKTLRKNRQQLNRFG
ncbi:AMP-binding protein [Flammeovirgaceae bacterium SG7u.111]|nr:AMP-binding protein [Flammeovirgaceae bacterium SG7u.132]WPO38713.1 AMP-binding protein [Flammeovirgaceae bacterium SG7u.111]